MTLEEAIKILSELHDQCCQADSIFCTDTTGARCEAVDMAISVLQAQDVTDTNVGKIDRYGYIGIETLLNFCENSKDHAVTPNDFMRMKRVRMPELCEDAVSRKDILDGAITHYSVSGANITYRNAVPVEYIESLPSVTLKRKTGKWVNNIHDLPVCDQCGYMTPYDRAIDDYEYGNYCPNCGAKMNGGEQE